MTKRPPYTVANLIKNRCDMTVYCLLCGHHSKLTGQMLADRIGLDHSVYAWDIRPKLKCSACGGKSVDISIVPNFVPTNTTGWFPKMDQ